MDAKSIFSIGMMKDLIFKGVDVKQARRRVKKALAHTLSECPDIFSSLSDYAVWVEELEEEDENLKKPQETLDSGNEICDNVVPERLSSEQMIRAAQERLGIDPDEPEPEETINEKPVSTSKLPYGRSPVHQAIYLDDIAHALKLLEDHPFYLYETDNSGSTPEEMARQMGKEEAVRRLKGWKKVYEKAMAEYGLDPQTGKKLNV